MEEYYPDPAEILTVIQSHVVMVGSMTYKNPDQCKDVDFVVSSDGARLLEQWDMWLVPDGPFAKTWIPYHDHGFNKAIDFFLGIFDTQDKSKWKNRITYDQAMNRNLKIVDFMGLRIKALDQGL